MSENLIPMVCALIFLSAIVPLAIGADMAIIYVDPPLQTCLSVGEILRVNITVAKVTNLFAWEFQLCYESEVLNASSWNPGPVFSYPNLHIEAFVFTDSYNETHGMIHLISTFFGSSQTFNGTTTLATIEFKVESLEPTTLHLQNTLLLDNSDPWPTAIAHTADDGLVTNAIPSDLNADGQVNIEDLSIVAKAFRSKPGEERWDPVADLDNNRVIDITDIAIVARKFGRQD